MRCPKCKFTSFDDLAACAKCSNDLSTIAQELQGTCTDTKVPFFLASVVQLQEEHDQTFSESQALPPIDDTDMNFNDTMAGGISATQTHGGFDTSFDSAEDEISLELGDIMPLDLDQLDAPIDLDDGDIFNETDLLPPENEGDNFDLNLTGDFEDLSADFDATEVMSANSFSDDIDLDLTGNFDESIGLDLSGDFEAFDLDDTGNTLVLNDGTAAFNPDATFSDADNLELDDDLQSTLTGEFPSVGDETGSLELDESILAELSDEDLPDDFSNDTPAASPAASSPAESTSDDFDLDLTGNFDSLDLDDTGTSLAPISDPDDTLSSGDFLAFDDTQEAPGDGQSGAELLAADDELDLDDLEKDANDDEPLNLDDSLAAGYETETTSDDFGLDLTGDFDSLDLDDTGTSHEPISAPDDTLSDSGILAFDDTQEAPSEEQLSAELMASIDDELDFDLDDLEVGSQDDEELSLEDSLVAEPAEELDQNVFRADDTVAESTDFALDDTLKDLDDEQLAVEGLPNLDDSLATETEDGDYTSGHSPAAILEQIDVSDLITAPEESAYDSSPEDAEIDLSELMEDDDESHDSDLEMLDEEIEEIELVDEDDDEVPPALPL